MNRDKIEDTQSREQLLLTLVTLKRQKAALLAACVKAVTILYCVNELQPFTVGDILKSEKLIEITGINPWCVNGGLADSESEYDLWPEIKSIESAIKAGEA